MEEEQIGKVTLYRPDGQNQTVESGAQEDIRQLQEITQQYQEEDYHSQITARKNWTAMYQLAESRGNVIEWIGFLQHAKVLELGAGCGAVTSVLLRGGASVTCQDENIHYCEINAARHQKAEGLTVYAMPFEQCAAQLDNDYDAVILIGMLAKADADTLLQKLRMHLKPQGKLVIALENKFGLKYWAGNKEAYTHTYFAGLENTAARQGVRLFTRKSLEALLEKHGFKATQFYYPYPDYRFAQDVYSDDCLPKKGDLTYHIANYEDDRIVLFDEQKVFDSIIEEGQFPLFSNSYLCIAACGGEIEQAAQEIIYTRYASDRSRAYAVRTDIQRNGQGGLQKVCKRPLYDEGEAHVRHIAQAYGQLCEQYEGSGMEFNRCTLIEETNTAYLEFEYIQGEALQTQVEQAVGAHDLKHVFDILQKLVQSIRSGRKNQPFAMTEEFTRVFGSITQPEVLEHAQCSAVSDIDLILPNIMVDASGVWNVIDYEWTFFFPIPMNFIIYRTLFFLNHENPSQEELSMDRLLEWAGISRQEADIYAQMEAGFQQFVTGGLVPYREMVNLLGRRYLNVVQLKEDYDRVTAQNELLKGKGIWKLAKKIKDRLAGHS